MGVEAVFYVSMVLFLVSILGLFISSDVISFFISRQIMIAAAVVNLLNFSLRIVPGDSGMKVLLVLGSVTFYLLEFTVLFYLYSNTDSMQKNAAVRDEGLFSLKKSDWWGEDRT